jgi:predicted choloylglycine hydrolase
MMRFFVAAAPAGAEWGSMHILETPADFTGTTAVNRRHWPLVLRGSMVALLLLLAGVLFYFKDQYRTLASLRRIPGTNAYVMDYYVDYNIDEVRKRGIDPGQVEDSILAVYTPKILLPLVRYFKDAYVDESIETIDIPGHHCSTLAVRTHGGKVFFGRNLDYKHDACLILKIHRDGLPDTVSVLDLHYLNLDRGDLEQTSLLRRVPLLFSPYYLEDGMNEYGVAVADMTVENVKPPYDPRKPNVIHSLAMRLILDYAKSTDEAIELLRQYNVQFVAETTHLLIADASGKSVVAEFIDGDIEVSPMVENWQVCTNHQICGKTEEENDTACERYRTASNELAKMSAGADAAAVMTVMQAVKQDTTMWSSVYELTSGEFRIAYRQQYERPYEDRIEHVK